MCVEDTRRRKKARKSDAQHKGAWCRSRLMFSRAQQVLKESTYLEISGRRRTGGGTQSGCLTRSMERASSRTEAARHPTKAAYDHSLFSLSASDTRLEAKPIQRMFPFLVIPSHSFSGIAQQCSLPMKGKLLNETRSDPLWAAADSAR